MFGFFEKRSPRTVSEITQNLTYIVNELEDSGLKFEEVVEGNLSEIQKLEASNKELQAELQLNQAVAGKLKDLLGM